MWTDVTIEGRVAEGAKVRRGVWRLADRLRTDHVVDDDALRLAQRSQRISVQIIVFSLLVLAVLIPTASLGVIGITVAVFAHDASERIAIANGLRVAQRIV